MDKDLLKGLVLLVGATLLLAGLFIVASDSGPQKAKCIANALKAGVAYGNIDKVCKLTEHTY